MAVTKRKISYYDEKTIEELRNIPNSYIPAVQTNVDNYKIPVSSFFDIFPTKDEVAENYPNKTEVYNNFPTKTELYNNFPTKTEMYDIIGRISGCNGIVWIYDNGNAYTDTISALNEKKLPIFVYESSASSGSGSSATSTGLAYIKTIDDDGIHFYSLIDTKAEFSEYYIKSNNVVESTECKNVDANILVESTDSNLYNKINEAMDYGQSVICKSGNKFMPLAEVSANNYNTIYCFRRDGLNEHGYWYVNNSNTWSFIQDT